MEGGLRRMLDRMLHEGSFTGDADEDAFLERNPTAVLLGLLYDQRVRAEYAFTGPNRLRSRLGHLDLKKISRMKPDVFQSKFAEPPAVHRFTNKMAEYTQQVARAIVDEYGGDAARLWNDGADFATIQKRLLRLPGFGKGKAAKMKYVLHFLGYRDFA
jgi:uncharacterized HhH-GPD family protein